MSAGPDTKPHDATIFVAEEAASPARMPVALIEFEQVREPRLTNEELPIVNARLSAAQDQLMQTEKLASIRQLAAGVAHEINNPVGYVSSNLRTLEEYLKQLFQMLHAYEEVEPLLANTPAGSRLASLRSELVLDFIEADVPALMKESKEGVARVREIVQDLKYFSHVDANQEWVWADLHRGIDSTLNIGSTEIKCKADVVKEYGEIPDVECLPAELNQVFLNLLVNAANAISCERGTITVRTGRDDDTVWVDIADNGCGIPKENLSRIFDPFFTTKPVGKGTGLGLSLSYGILKKHCGNLEVSSEMGVGTTFRATVPIRRTSSTEASA